MFVFSLFSHSPDLLPLTLTLLSIYFDPITYLNETINLHNISKTLPSLSQNLILTQLNPMPKLQVFTNWYRMSHLWEDHLD